MTLSDEQFLTAFFSAPNLVWPERDPKHASAAYLERFLPALPLRGETPLVLPRKEAGWSVPQTYVVCWSRSHAGRMRTLLTEAVGHNWCDFDGRLAHLRPEDPIDAAVLSLAGPGATYILRPTDARTYKGLFRALSRLVFSLDQRPTRTTPLPLPLGRLLRDFEISLAAGQALTSQELLGEIERSGGISPENVAFLRTRRLGQLGADEELLNSSTLRTIVATEPPRLVREAILGAWRRSAATPGATPTQLVGELREFRADIALLVDDTIASTDDADAWAACAVVAVGRQDGELARQLLDTKLPVPEDLRDALREIVRQDAPVASGTPVARGAERSGSQPPPIEAGETIAAPMPLPDSWLSWVAALSHGVDAELSPELVDGWAAPGNHDIALATAIGHLSEAQVGLLLGRLGAFIDADDYAQPAWRTAGELVRLLLIRDSLTPSDLGGMSALLSIFLRGAPASAEYSGLLQDLGDFRRRWVSIATAAAAIDIADLVVCGTASSADAQQSFIARALESLFAMRHRLPDSLRMVGSLATADVGLGWDWTIEPRSTTRGEAPPRLPKTLLLYSLDEAVLSRAQAAVKLLYPSIRVHVSADKVGNDALRERARSAELTVLATRRATHSATGFIQSHVGNARVFYADGCGSGSMIRAIEDGISSFAD